MNAPKRPADNVTHEMMINKAVIKQHLKTAKALMSTDAPGDIKDIVAKLTETAPTSVEKLQTVFRHIYIGILGHEPKVMEEPTPELIAARDLFFACRSELPVVNAVGNHAYPWRGPTTALQFN